MAKKPIIKKPNLDITNIHTRIGYIDNAATAEGEKHIFNFYLDGLDEYKLKHVVRIANTRWLFNEDYSGINSGFSILYWNTKYIALIFSHFACYYYFWRLTNTLFLTDKVYTHKLVFQKQKN